MFEASEDTDTRLRNILRNSNLKKEETLNKHMNNTYAEYITFEKSVNTEELLRDQYSAEDKLRLFIEIVTTSHKILNKDNVTEITTIIKNAIKLIS